MLHRRQRARLEEPALGRLQPARPLADRVRVPAAQGARGLPALGRRAVLVPVPVPARAVAPLAGTGRVVEAARAQGGHAVGVRRVAGIERGLPRLAGVERRGRLVVALEQEAGAAAHLRHRRERPEVPDRRRDPVVARAEKRREVVGFESPVQDVRACRARSDAAAVDVEQVAVVGAHVHDEPFWNRGEPDRPAEVEDARVLLGPLAGGDPRRGPLLAQQRSGHARLRVCRGRQHQQQDRAESHAGGPGRIRAFTTESASMSASARSASASGYSRVTSRAQPKRSLWRAIISTERCRCVYS